MSSSFDLTGRWVGHYQQRDQKYPISADLVQAGERLSGWMRDGHPDRECSIFESACEAGLPPGADEQIEANLREAVPDAPAGPIRHVSHLPSASILEGWYRGQTVSFLKKYQGSSFVGYKVGDKLIGIEVDAHAVHYEGHLRSDGLAIEGRWWIDANPTAGTARSEGQFRLDRANEGEGLSEAQASCPILEVHHKDTKSTKKSTV